MRVEGEVTERLRELGRRRGATLHQVLMAGVMVLMWRYTGQEDVALGTLSAGRSRREVEELVGFFVNTLVVRAGGARGHGRVPCEKLGDELGVERDTSRPPLVQVSCVLQNAPDGGLDLP